MAFLTLKGLFILIGLVCFACSALGVSSRFNLQSSGLFFWLLATTLV